MPRKGENIYKRKDGRWEGRYIKERINGKAKYGYVFAHSYKEVKERLSKAKSNATASSVGYPYHYGVEKKVLLLVHFMAGLNRFLIRDMIFLILKGIELLVSRK